jgi:hypothetical protein
MSSTLTIGHGINTDGLQLYLDADNLNSYPGYGTTWYDLSVNSVNVLTGSMKYVDASLSSFSSSIQNGSTITSSIDFYAPNLTSVATIETVCRFNNFNANANSQAVIFGWNNYWISVSPSNRAIGFFDNASASSSILPASGSSINGGAPIFGIWYYLVFEMYSGNMSSNKMWVNNIQQNLAPIFGPSNPANQTFNNGNGSIAKFKAMAYTDTGTNYNGVNDYAMFRIYNRTLSQQEITNNYNYYKPFYNLY